MMGYRDAQWYIKDTWIVFSIFAKQAVVHHTFYHSLCFGLWQPISNKINMHISKSRIMYVFVVNWYILIFSQISKYLSQVYGHLL